MDNRCMNCKHFEPVTNHEVVPSPFDGVCFKMCNPERMNLGYAYHLGRCPNFERSDENAEKDGKGEI